MNFRDWLKTHETDDSPLGQLARDIALFPPIQHTWTVQDLRHHLRVVLIPHRAVQLECARPLPTLTAAKRSFKKYVVRIAS